MKALIVTDCSFPGSAMASRILSFKSLFVELGYNIHIISTKTLDNNIIFNNVYNEDDYSYEIIESKRNYRTQSFFGNENLKNRIEKIIKNEKIDFVFTTSLGANFVEILNICKKNNIKLILEQCEWFDYSSFGLKKLDPRYIRFNRNIKKYFTKADGVIAITRLLEDYYKSCNTKVIRVPSIVDVVNKQFNNKTNNKKIKLVYTGNTSNSKELLRPIIEAMNNYNNHFELHIYGSSKQEVINNIGNSTLLEQLKDDIFIHGTIKQKDVEEVLLNADYQIFIRPNRRSSNAGFPTKLVESMAVGTPIITNNTGDICMYLKDEYNGYVSNGITTKDIEDVFCKILKSNDNLRNNARKTAEEYFDYRIYKNQVKGFIETL